MGGHGADVFVAYRTKTFVDVAMHLLVELWFCFGFIWFLTKCNALCTM